METIRIDNLSKTYKLRKGQTVTALQPLSMSVSEGEIFGLLGPNGAGKTTLIKLLLGITHPTAGSASLLGTPVSSMAARRLVGFLPENHRYPPYLTGEQTLLLYGNLSGMQGAALRSRIGELLERVSLQGRGTQRVRQYSKGMLQRLGLAQALLNKPKVLFLDEPTDGIDPRGRKEIRDLLIEQKNKGTTIFLNSHLLSEVELITDRVAFMDKGLILKTGYTKNIVESRDIYSITLAEWSDAIPTLPNVLHAYAESRTIEVQAATPRELNAIVDELRQQALLITTIVPKRNSLEEQFLSLVSQQ